MPLIDRKNAADEAGNDSMQRLLCGIDGCYKRWCVRSEAQMPLCAVHRNYFDQKKPDFLAAPKPSYIEPIEPLDFLDF